MRDKLYDLVLLLVWLSAVAYIVHESWNRPRR